MNPAPTNITIAPTNREKSTGTMSRSFFAYRTPTTIVTIPAAADTSPTNMSSTVKYMGMLYLSNRKYNVRQHAVVKYILQ